jgi:hypothetical protein
LLGVMNQEELYVTLAGDYVLASPSASHIDRVKKDGSEIITNLIDGVFYMANRVYDAGRLFWITSGSGFPIAYCDLDQCAATTHVTSASADPSFGLAYDSPTHMLYFEDLMSKHLQAATTNAVWLPVEVNSSTSAGQASVAYGGAIYYQQTTGGISYIARISPAGGSAAVVATDSIGGDYKSITATNGHLFWISGSVRALVWIPIPTGVGTSAPDVFFAESGIRSVTSDADNIYWVTETTLETCPASGCSNALRRVLLSLNLDFSAVAVDDQALYWVSGIARNPFNGNDMQGSVWKLAK